MSLSRAALRELSAQPHKVRHLLHDILHIPLAAAAQAILDATPILSLSGLAGGEALASADLAPLLGRLDRKEWNARLDEQLAIGLLIRGDRPRHIFEIGTFDGDMTAYLAEQMGPEAHIWTLDLPPEQIDAMGLDWFRGKDIGRVYHESPEIAKRITQLAGDSQTYDYASYIGSIDMVFVDASHCYAPVLSDSRNALRLARPGGIILWHDFSLQWGQVVLAVHEATAGLPLQRIAGTSLALLITGESLA